MRTISTPLSSSPWMAPESQTWGPGLLPLMTATGRYSCEPVGTLANGRSIRDLRPGATTRLPTVIGSLRISGPRATTRCFQSGVVLDELDYLAGNVDAAGGLDALEAWGGIDLDDQGSIG